MKKTVKSFRYALAGIIHAIATERNFPLFLVSFGLELILAFSLGINHFEWVILIMAGGMFLSVELLNTAIERQSNAFSEDRPRFSASFDRGIKLTKDVAAAASFISLLLVISVSLIVLLPRIFPLIR